MDDQAKLFERRKAFISEGRFSEAREIAGQMLEKNPSDPALHNQMAWSMATLSDFAGAIRHQERAVELAPKNAAYRLTLIKYFQGRAEQERAVVQKLQIADGETFEEMQRVEKQVLEKMCQDVLNECLDAWPHRIDLDNKMRTKWVLRDHRLDSVADWFKFVPQKFKAGEIAEIIGVGSFTVLNPLETIQKRISRGMPWELPIAVLLMELVSRADPNSIVIEVGANIGTMTVPLALNFRGKVLAFEPVERTLGDLKKNLALNKIENVLLEKKACGAQAGTGEMVRLLEENRGMAQLNLSPSGSVDVTTIDIEAKKIGSPVSLIKIDVEGHEVEVLAGAGEVLRKDKPLIVIELLNENVQASVARMKAAGYEAKRVFRSDWLFYPARP